jgi:hypothetical protein
VILGSLFHNSESSLAEILALALIYLLRQPIGVIEQALGVFCEFPRLLVKSFALFPGSLGHGYMMPQN